MLEKKKTFSLFGKLTLSLFFNVLLLFLSVALMLYIIFGWGIWDYNYVLTYVASAFVSLLVFYYLKLVLLKGLSSDSDMAYEGEESAEDSGSRQTILLVAAILLMLVVPLVILFVSDLGLIILNGIIAGASISEIVLHLRKKK